MRRKGLSIPSILTLVLTVLVLAGCGFLYTSFRSDADVPMRVMKIAGLLQGEETAIFSTAAPKSAASVVVMPTQVPAMPAAGNVVAAATAAPLAPAEVTLTLAGTIAFESNISDSTYNKKTQSCDYQNILSGIASDNRGDIRMAAISQVFNAEEKQYSDKKAHPSAALEMNLAGFNMGIIQGNALESGAQSALDTANILYQNGIQPVGVNAEKTAQALMVEQNGIRIAVVSYAEKLSNKAASALQSTAGLGILSMTEQDQLIRTIRDIKNQGCHCIIVYYQWSKTDVTQVSDQMKKTAMDLTAAGADIIVGTGPGRLLPAAKLHTNGDDGVEREALVLYSMGTLLSESRDGNDLSGALAHVNIRARGNGVNITGLSYTPTYIWRQSNQYRVINSAGEAPADMSDSQKGVMERCKGRTDNALSNMLQLEFGD